MNGTRVYLAGGFKSGWQDRLIASCPKLLFEDPREHGLSNEDDYTVWDLAAIRRSDIIFAYFESSNPAGYALALEVGYAKALGKLIVFVDEMASTGEVPGRYLAMIRAVSDKVFTSYDDAVNYMSKLAQ